MFAELTDGVVVIRVLGRGSFANSVELKKLAESLAEKHATDHYQFILDLHDCSTMDSTFMGVLASIGLRQKRDGNAQMAIVNANEQSTRLLQTLGLSHFINVRREGQTPDAAFSAADFQCVGQHDVSKMERIIHMIEAHQNLCDVDNSNNVRFESVLKYLHESLDREKH